MKEAEAVDSTLESSTPAHGIDDGVGELAGSAGEVRGDSRVLEDFPDETAVSRTKLNVIRAAVLLLLLAALAAAFVLLGEAGDQPAAPVVVSNEDPEATAAPAVPPAHQSAEQTPAAPAPSESPAAEPATGQTETTLPALPTLASGFVLVGSTRIAVADSISVFYPLTNKLEIAFYREKLTDEDRKKILNLNTLLDPQAPPADFVAVIGMERGSTVCDRSSVSDFRTTAFQRPGGLSQTVEFDFQKNAGGLVDFACRLVENGQLSANLSQSIKKKIDLQTTVDLQWDLKTTGPIIYSKAPARYVFNSQGTRQVAIWNKESNTLEVGFFAGPLKEEDYSRIRADKSLNALPNNQPLVTVNFDIKEGFSTFQPDSIRGYGVHFYRNPAQQLRFPGDKEKLSFYYVMTTKQSPELERVTGHLHEGDEIRASMKSGGPKQFDNLAYQFDWDLRISTMLMDVNSEPLVTFARDEDSDTPRAEPPTKTGGEIQVGKAMATLVDAVAIFYPQENDLAVGLYSEKLTAEERTTLQNYGTVWNQINGKLPNLVVFFNLKPGSTSLTRDSVLHYRLVFVREKLGQFFFPGPTDRATIKKLAEEVTPAEVPYLGGTVKDGKSAAFVLNGEYVSKVNNLLFRWKVEGDVPIVVSKGG